MAFTIGSSYEKNGPFFKVNYELCNEFEKAYTRASRFLLERTLHEWEQFELGTGDEVGKSGNLLYEKNVRYFAFVKIMKYRIILY